MRKISFKRIFSLFKKVFQDGKANSQSMNLKAFMVDLNWQALRTLMKSHCAVLARSIKQ
jgi:hypothetical protein